MLWIVGKSLVSLIPPDIVLFIIDEIPSIDEMVYKIANTGTFQADGDVGPAHTAALGAIEFVLERMIYL